MFAGVIQINRRWMSKPSKKNLSPSSFYMKGSGKSEFRRTIIIDFSPLQAYVRQEMKAFDQSRSILPTYNPDKLIFTPTFHLPSVSLDEQHYAQKFTQKMQQYQQIDIDEIMMPRPRNKDYCNVCEVRFEDYLEHSMSGQHADAIARNRYQRRIKRMCRRYYQREMDRMRGRMRSGSESQGGESVKAGEKE